MSEMRGWVETARAVLRRETAALMLANLGAALAGIATGVVAARALGPEGRGDLAVIVFWPTLIATLVDLGVADAVTLRTARDPATAHAIQTNGTRLAALAGLAGAVAGVFAMPLVLRADQASLLTDARLALLYVPLSSLAAVPVGTLLGLHRFRAVAAIRFITACSYTAAMLLAVLTGNGSVRVLMWLTVAARGLPLVLAMPFLRGAAPHRQGRSKTSIVSQARDGATLHGARLANVLGASEDRVLASWMLTQTAIGYWQVASALTVVMQFVSQAVSQHLYSKAASGDPDQQDMVYRAYVRSVSITGAVAVLGAPLLPVIVPLLYGSDFAPAVFPALIVMAAAVAAAGAATLQAGAKAALRTPACIVSEAVGMATMAAVAWVLVPVWHEIGLAAAYLAGRGSVLLWMMLAARTLFGIGVGGLMPMSARFYGALRRELASLAS